MRVHNFHVSGVLNHGGKPGASAFIWDDRWPHDPNAFLETIVRSLKAHAENAGELPDVLYLQLDNAASTNKNKFVLCFAALLVAWGLFRKVKLSFLQVGHTHEDIDQMFSRFAEALRRADSLTWQAMAQLFRDHFTFDGSGPSVHFMSDVYDYKAWMEPVLKPMKYHTEPGCFKFEMNSNKTDVLVFARQSMSVSKREAGRWEPAEGFKMVSVKSARALLDKPLARVAPRPVDTKAVRQTVQAFVKAGVMNEAELQQWEQYLTDLEQDVATACKECNRLRAQETLFAAVKTDTKEQRNEKNKKRKAAQVALVKHRADGQHPAVSPRNVLGKLLLHPGNQASGQVQVAPVSARPTLRVTASSPNAFSALRFAVGVTPVHLRARLTRPVAGDMFACNVRCDDSEGQELAVGKIEAVLNNGKFRVHWFGNHTSKQHFTKAYLPCWKPSAKGSEWYAGAKPRSKKHQPLMETGEFDFADYGFTLTKAGKLRVSTVRRLCAIPAIAVKCAQRRKTGKCRCAKGESDSDSDDSTSCSSSSSSDSESDSDDALLVDAGAASGQGDPMSESD